MCGKRSLRVKLAAPGRKCPGDSGIRRQPASDYIGSDHFTQNLFYLLCICAGVFFTHTPALAILPRKKTYFFLIVNKQRFFYYFKDKKPLNEKGNGRKTIQNQIYFYSHFHCFHLFSIKIYKNFVVSLISFNGKCRL